MPNNKPHSVEARIAISRSLRKHFGKPSNPVNAARRKMYDQRMKEKRERAREQEKV